MYAIDVYDKLKHVKSNNFIDTFENIIIVLYFV